MIGIRKAYPNISFIYGVDIPEYGIYAILDSPVPEYDPDNQWIEENLPVQGPDGRYYRSYTVYTLPEGGTNVIFQQPGFDHESPFDGNKL